MLIEHNFGAKKVFGGNAEFKPPILRSSQNDILPLSICKVLVKAILSVKTSKTCGHTSFMSINI